MKAISVGDRGHLSYFQENKVKLTVRCSSSQKIFFLENSNLRKASSF